eukprot:scaffold18498_cov117-Cylindrotheca_fusiformis.AAC.2
MAPINTSLSKQLSTSNNLSPSNDEKNRNLKEYHHPEEEDDIDAYQRSIQDEAKDRLRELPKQQQKKTNNSASAPMQSVKSPISPAAVKSSSAWQHASVLLRKQQLQSRIKSSEERDQEAPDSAELEGTGGSGGARIGAASCWGSLQSVFMLPKGLVELKARHAALTAATDGEQDKTKPANLKKRERKLSGDEIRTSLSDGL